MSLNLVHNRSHRTGAPAWSSTAFIVEAVFLLVFLAAATAIFVQSFALASAQSEQSLALSRAVAAAQQTAEHFAADPTRVAATDEIDGMRVTCEITEEQHDNGTLYHATITVYASGTQSASPLYAIETARYGQEEAR